MTLANLLGKGLEKAETDAAEVSRYLDDPSEQEVGAVIEAVERLRGQLTAWIRKNHPELLEK